MALKALVIEDNEDNAELISFILKYAGYSVVWAKSGLDGLQMAKDERPDFIILDIQLPDIDGFEVLEYIRKEDILQYTPVIVMSSYDLDGDKTRIEELGGNYYIEKPISPQSVMSDIESVLKIARDSLYLSKGVENE